MRRRSSQVPSANTNSAGHTYASAKLPPSCASDCSPAGGPREARRWARMPGFAPSASWCWVISGERSATSWSSSPSRSACSSSSADWGLRSTAS
eukprot:13834276-Alexandrium_andersonii.AAC.1